MYRGDRVLVTAMWSTYVGMYGVVTATSPHLMIKLDGDRLPIRVGDREVSRSDAELAMTGAE